MTQPLFETQVLAVDQPLGRFYIARVPVRVLLQVCFSDVLEAFPNDDASRPYRLEGTQRERQEKRLVQIGDYIDREDSAFPNAIILAANIRQTDGLVEPEPTQASELAELPGANQQEIEEADRAEPVSRRWSISEYADGSGRLVIPTEAKLAAVIDGQHRLWGFARASVLDRLDMQLSCAIYMDLARPFQAQLFATINSTQKRVDKSLTYELFGYNLEDEPPEFWAPDKLAVFLARRLSVEKNSPLAGQIRLSPRTSQELDDMLPDAGWQVSTAVVVDGILRLISSNPKKDANDLLTPARQPRIVLEGPAARRDGSPLRAAYIGKQDAVVYKMIENFLAVCKEVFWKNADAQSFITRTVGIQAQFDILRLMARDAYENRSISEAYFADRLQGAKDLDFSEAQFRSASGAGRSIIRRAIAARVGLANARA